MIGKFFFYLKIKKIKIKKPLNSKSFINDSTKWDDYRFYNWSGIDIFCYFSHKYITIPPLSWINASHSNGVKIIGTFIVEHQEGGQRLAEVLQSDDSMHEVAEAMVFVAKYCKFEGWLINVECNVEPTKVGRLRDFVGYLTRRIHEEIPGGLVIWYDSVIDSGILSWQNELNLRNKLFFDVCDGIFLNYTWHDINLKNTEEMIKTDPVKRLKNVYVGLDVFGRGQLAKFHSYLTVAKIKKYNFSVAIFAPGWTFQEMNVGFDIYTAQGNEIVNSNFIKRNDIFWTLLWRNFNTFGPTTLPFKTSFCLGSGKFKNRYGTQISNQPWFNLSSQEYQISIPSNDMSVSRYFDDSWDNGSCLKILNKSSAMRLFVCDFSCDQGIVFSYVVKNRCRNCDLEILLHIFDEESQKNLEVILGSEFTTANALGRKFMKNLKDHELSSVMRQIHGRGERILPETSPLNGWEIRFYYLNFDRKLSAKIVDIGVRIKTLDPKDVYETYSVLLGAINVHQANLDNDDVMDQHFAQVIFFNKINFL